MSFTIYICKQDWPPLTFFARSLPTSLLLTAGSLLQIVTATQHRILPMALVAQACSPMVRENLYGDSIDADLQHCAGKYSFYPASTGLWNLADRAALQEAYSWTSNILGQYGLSCPPFPRISSSARDDPKDSWFLKRYPSAYIPLNDRLHMIQLLQEYASATTNASEPKPEFLLESTVESWSYDEISQLFTFTIRTNDASGRKEKAITLTARYAIFAGGRFFPLLMAKHDKCPKRFLRVEVGLRIEDTSTNPFWRDLGNPH